MTIPMASPENPTPKPGPADPPAATMPVMMVPGASKTPAQAAPSVRGLPSRFSSLKRMESSLTLSPLGFDSVTSVLTQEFYP
jgi:hypothetical protein